MQSSFDLAAALDAYEASCRRLLAHPLEAKLYAEFRASIAGIREHGVSTPALTVLALQLAIAHAELESALWQSRAGHPAVDFDAVRARHATALHALRIGEQARKRAWSAAEAAANLVRVPSVTACTAALPAAHLCVPDQHQTGKGQDRSSQ